MDTNNSLNVLHEISELLTNYTEEGKMSEQKNIELQNGLRDLNRNRPNLHRPGHALRCIVTSFDQLVRKEAIFLDIIDNAANYSLSTRNLIRIFSDYHSDNKEICLALLRRGISSAIAYASDGLKDDEDLVLLFLKFWPQSIMYASRRLRRDIRFMTKVVQEDCDILEYLMDYHVMSDTRIVTELVKEDGFVLKYVGTDLKNNKDIVKLAIQNCLEPLKFAGTEIKNDREFFLELVKSDGYSLNFASTEIKKDREIVLAAIENYPHAIQYASDLLRNDFKVAFAAMEKDPGTKHHVGYITNTPRFKKDFNKLCRNIQRHRRQFKHCKCKH